LQVSNRLLASHNILRISSAGYKILEASAYQKKFELKRVGPITVIATAGMVTIIKHDGKDSTTKKKANCTDDIHL
jgi:hypothetical protein